MGEASEMILNGICCQHCHEVIDGKDIGYPRSCGCDNVSITKEQKKRKRRQKRKAERLTSQSSKGWKKFTEHHWYKSVAGQRLDFWPSTRKCRWQGTVYQQIDDIDDFVNFHQNKEEKKL